MKERAVQIILDNMRNSDDPVVGAVFEKEVKTSFEDFCVFMLFAYKDVTMIRQNENGTAIYMFYNGDEATDHIGTYVPSRITGYFGGSRVGSQNPMRDPDDPDVKNPFDISKFEG